MKNILLQKQSPEPGQDESERSPREIGSRIASRASCSSQQKLNFPPSCLPLSSPLLLFLFEDFFVSVALLRGARTRTFLQSSAGLFNNFCLTHNSESQGGRNFAAGRALEIALRIVGVRVCVCGGGCEGVGCVCVRPLPVAAAPPAWPSEMKT